MSRNKVFMIAVERPEAMKYFCLYFQTPVRDEGQPVALKQTPQNMEPMPKVLQASPSTRPGGILCPSRENSVILTAIEIMADHDVKLFLFLMNFWISSGFSSKSRMSFSKVN